MPKGISNRSDITPEEYAGVKERFPKIVFNDADMTFVSSKGNVTSAALLKTFIPVPPGGDERSRKGGEATKALTADKFGRYLKNLENGMRISKAAEKAGLSYQSVLKRRKTDPEFIQREKDAEAIAAEPVENSLYDAAVNGNVPAATKWLEKRAPDRWPSDKTVIETKATLELDATDHIQNIIAMMAKLQQRAELQGEVIDVEVIEPNQIERRSGGG